jgi:hypothetical protein
MAQPPRFVRPACVLLAFVFSSVAAFTQNIAVTALHAPTINGGARIEGSVQQLRGENVSLNGNATITEDLLVPGTPNIQINGNASWQGPQVGVGATTPAGYAVGLGGDVTLRYVRTRTVPVALPTVPRATGDERNAQSRTKEGDGQRGQLGHGPRSQTQRTGRHSRGAAGHLSRFHGERADRADPRHRRRHATRGLQSSIAHVE